LVGRDRLVQGDGCATVAAGLECGADGDLPDPRLQRPLAPVAPAPSERTRERLLDDIMGRLRRADHRRERRAKDGIAVAVDLLDRMGAFVDCHREWTTARFL
jgi:hypothetical protein